MMKREWKNSEFLNYITLIGTLSNIEVRLWYNSRDKNIINEINKSLSKKEQAMQAHSLRNKYREQARQLMKDRKLAKKLEINNANLPFEHYINKYLNQGYTGDYLYDKILESSTRSNSAVNKELGITC